MKRKVKAELKFRTYTLVERAVEEGINGGWMKAHKHTNTPRAEDVKERIREYVMLALDEILIWEDPT